MTTWRKASPVFLAALLAGLGARATAAELPAYGKVDAMAQALNTQMCLSCNYDGNNRAGQAGAVSVGGWESGKKGALASRVKNIFHFNRIDRRKPAQPPVPKLEYGPLKDRPEEKAPDPNRWNPAIEGANGAAYFGLLGLMVAGPVGLIFGVVAGFLMMYYGRKHNDR